MLFLSLLGTGFLPNETAIHHREKILDILDKALIEAKVTLEQIG